MTGEERLGMTTPNEENATTPERKPLIIGPKGPSPIVTYVSTCCAVMSVMASAMGNFRVAIALLVASGVLDSFDGRFASMFERDGDAREFGRWIDSLSDVVAFGIAPATLAMSVSLVAVTPAVVALSSVTSCLYVVATVHRLAWHGAISGDGEGPGNGFRGVPVTYASLAFLGTVLACTLLGAPRMVTSVALAVCEAIMAFLFVWDVPVPRLGTKGLMALSIIGVALAVVLLVV